MPLFRSLDTALILAVTLPIACAGTVVGGTSEADHPSPDQLDGGAAAPVRDGSVPLPAPTAQTDGALPPDDPFAPQPDTSEGLTNVSSVLADVLERSALREACAHYVPATSSRREMLLCGKAMFFYEGFGTGGVPAPFVKLLMENFADVLGPGFSKLGMVADPTSTESLPIGMAPGAKLGNVDTYAFTCASCHFAQLPDGRYAVGAPNHGFEYGTLNLSLAVFPLIAAFNGATSDHHPAAVAKIQPLLDKVKRDPSLQGKVLGALLPMISAAGSAPSFPKETEGLYASWRSGTMDFFIEPLPFNDHVHTISKISALWGIPTDAEATRRGMATAMLGFTGGTASLMHFAESFVDLGGGVLSAWPDEKLQPLVEYIYSLRAPANSLPPDAKTADVGRRLFDSKGCASCHSGPRGSGTKVYTYEEIGTDPALKKWANPSLSGQPEYGIRFPAGDTLTHGIKSPRLNGEWAFSRLLHNGAVSSLEELFCVDHARGDRTELAYGNEGHDMTCNGLTRDEKVALIAYLRAN